MRVTAPEARLFRLVAEVNSRHRLGCTVRVAGGWVRDKLLGRSTTDIDLALDRGSGRSFATLLARELAEGPSVATIRANPSQSKHLETACCSIFGLDVDFVHLRAEDYTAASRIPAATPPGSAEQDALRRDFTINALFYNLSTREVEDLTGQGLHDLRCGVLRTPAAPARTLAEDPLRAIRAFRFASQLGFTPVPELCRAASRREVLDGLRTKVSGERRVAETLKTLSGTHWRLGLGHMLRSGVLAVVLGGPVLGPAEHVLASVPDAEVALAGLVACQGLPWRGTCSRLMALKFPKALARGLEEVLRGLQDMPKGPGWSSSREGVLWARATGPWLDTVVLLHELLGGQALPRTMACAGVRGMAPWIKGHEVHLSPALPQQGIQAVLDECLVRQVLEPGFRRRLEPGHRQDTVRDLVEAVTCRFQSQCLALYLCRLSLPLAD